MQLEEGRVDVGLGATVADLNEEVHHVEKHDTLPKRKRGFLIGSYLYHARHGHQETHDSHLGGFLVLFSLTQVSDEDDLK